MAFAAACRDPIGREWALELGDSPVSAPLVTSDLVAVGTATGVVILEPSGSQRCRLDIDGKTHSPRVFETNHLVAAGGTTVQALDDHCQPLWKRTVNERIGAAPAIADDVVIISTVSGRLEAFAYDGTPKWTFTGPQSTVGFVGPPAVATPQAFGPGALEVAGSVLYVMDGAGVLFAIATDDGRPLWSVGLADAAESTPVVTRDRIIVGADDGGVHALDTETHALAWRLATDDRVRASAFVDNDIAYIGSDDRHLYAIDTESGALRWVSSLDGPVRARPAVYRNLVLVAGGYGDGQLYALERDDGARFWEHRTGVGIVSDIAIYGDMLYAVSVDGGVYAFKLWRTFER